MTHPFNLNNKDVAKYKISNIISTFTLNILSLNNMKKTIMITGATAGFGRAIAVKFAKNGYNVIITGRRKERLE